MNNFERVKFYVESKLKKYFLSLSVKYPCTDFFKVQLDLLLFFNLFRFKLTV